MVTYARFEWPDRMHDRIIFHRAVKKQDRSAGRLALANSRWLTFRTTIRQMSFDLSASWHTPMKEIFKGAIVIHPAFCSEVTFVTDKKGRVLIVPLKFH
jgi:hypothetical protein